MNIVLTGFMGTGKTSVSSELAKILGWEMLDTDHLVETTEKTKISEIFANFGETYFRDCEAKVIEEVSRLDKKIISTGGGAVLRHENINNLQKNSMIICLEASPEEIYRRLKTDDTRPLLQSENPFAKIKELLAVRQNFYAKNNYFIDTNGLNPTEIAEKIVSFLPRARFVNLENDKSYQIFIGKSFRELIHWLPGAKNRKILIIADKNIEKLYLPDLLAIFKGKNYQVSSYVFQGSEESKNFEQINLMYKACAKNNLDRSSLIIAFGGGVVGDMAGFVAATYLRGIDFVQLPTTLLAQVDASIGGKTGFDLEEGKNLVGAFYQPSLVWIDQKFLKTLDEREFKNGLAEVVKYGAIYSREYWDFFEKNIDKVLAKDDKIIATMLEKSVNAKAYVVEKDEKESNLRKILNFGHTLGHALETYENYQGLKHGEAVAVGMEFAAFVSVKLGLCDVENLKKLEILLEKIGFENKKIRRKLQNTENNFDITKIIEIMSRDKKSFDGKIDFILPEELGKVKIVALDLEIIKNFLIDWRKSGQY